VYINWGAGTTSTSVKVKERGFTLLNYDPGIPEGTQNYITKSQLIDMKVDGIISHNVLDHLQNPVRDLLLMKSLLKPGGRMIHASDGFAYELHYTKFHLFFFVGKSMEYLTKAIDMECKHIPDKIKWAGRIDIVQWTKNNGESNDI
jgi:2-polyprenyl-3-methyl-5-hydroxy-6-metoxy-1,4-benzoquinol methylase